MLERIRTVLIHTSHPGNIGACARAMKNMGLSDLCLVSPKTNITEESVSIAAGAESILKDVKIVQTLEEAIQDCSFVLGMSARTRSIEWEMMEPKVAALKIMEELQGQQGQGGQGQQGQNTSTRVAILLGPESSGLSNSDLQSCHAQIIIPANPEYSSLNLAQALQIMSYEIRMAYISIDSRLRREDKDKNKSLEGTVSDMEGFYRHLEDTMLQVHFFDPERNKELLPRLKRLFARARPDKIELNILRGLLTAIQKSV